MSISTDVIEQGTGPQKLLASCTRCFAPKISGSWKMRKPALGRAPSDSNSSTHYFDFSVFSVIWGVCFSLKANPNGIKRSDSGAVLAQQLACFLLAKRDGVLGPHSQPPLRSKRNNFASLFFKPEIMSGIMRLAIAAKVIPLPPYPNAK